MTGASPLAPVDPFDLPDWLGEAEVTWSSESGIRAGHLVAGVLTAPGEEPFPCDLLAVDEAYPEAVADDAARRRAHQAWRHGEVLVASRSDRTTLVVPGTRFDADRVLDALGRLARAVGAAPDRYAARLHIGDARRP